MGSGSMGDKKPTSEQGPAPAPISGDKNLKASVDISSVSSPLYAPSAFAPDLTNTSQDALVHSPSPFASSSLTSEISSAPEPALEEDFPTTELPEESGSKNVKWCAVGDEFINCQYFISLLTPVDDYSWKCVSRKTTFECLEAIKNKEADLISLDSGLGYIAFMNYSMKAIMAEEYCYQAGSYDAVAIVNKRMCDRKGDLSLKDFKGKKSCHAGYLTAAGWNYPVNYILSSILQKQPQKTFSPRNDEDVISNFFSASCAPSELEGRGLCSACGNSSTCSLDKTYSRYSGAFRCLIEEIGDIAFLKADTALLYSFEGINNQSWSTMSVADFMYLCPEGGCRVINGFPGDCKFGSVPANTIMTRNSLPHSKKLAIVQTLLNASWTDALFSGKNWADHLLSVSTQGLTEVKELTRSYLGISAHVSQTIENLNTINVENTNVTENNLQGFHMHSNHDTMTRICNLFFVTAALYQWICRNLYAITPNRSPIFENKSKKLISNIDMTAHSLSNG
ncbi:hypothetical protein KI387_032599 [Taxus chinensis]|uniref:Transferrin-like domain-containing protein n=1 Tax=Taxus chinensis TaxID=29808 RepID=A0AA38BS75_TAXCH|nr:hypothetical protein KI387_032599 [Taxus chinensis]